MEQVQKNNLYCVQKGSLPWNIHSQDKLHRVVWYLFSEKKPIKWFFLLIYLMYVITLDE
jgi:hypothetical protein